MRLAWRLGLIGIGLILVFSSINCVRRTTALDPNLEVYPEDLPEVPQIRILVRDNLKHAALAVNGPYELTAFPTDPEQPRLGGGEEAVRVVLRPTFKGIRLGRPEAPYGAVAVRPLGNTRITVDDVDYGAAVVILRVVPKGAQKEEDLHLRILALVDLERYLVGVVPAEMPAGWPLDALRAQCVASRSYALYKIKTRAHLPFDVRNTTASQVWNPALRNNPLINTVVNSTRGVVVTDNYRLFPTYFSSRCGGETKDGVNVFISRHIAPLSAVRCPYCRSKKGLRQGSWQFSLIVEELQKRLNRRGHAVGPITRLRALDDKGRTQRQIGRVYDVTVEFERNGKKEMLTIPAETFRRAVGTGKRELASSYFRVSLRDGEAHFEGRGFGHGVGMCQYGARQLAEAHNYDWREILQHYYHASTPVRLWD